MKKLILLAIIAFSFFSAEAQLLRRSTVDDIKQSKIIVALTEDERLNEVWKAAIQNRWKFTEIIDYVPEKEAFKKVKSGEADYILFLNTKVVARSRDYKRGDYIDVYRNEGMAVELKKRKMTNGPVAGQYIPPFGDDNEYAEAFVNFGIDALQYQFETMINNDLKSNMKLYDAYNKNGSQLKDRTLFVLDGWIHKKITIEEVKEMYLGKLEVVPFADWKEAILEKQEGRAYVVVVPVPTGKSYIYLHYLMDAGTGHVLGMGQPRVTFGAFGYSKGNSGFINEKNLKVYNELME